jgi:hypothetical protein
MGNEVEDSVSRIENSFVCSWHFRRNSDHVVSLGNPRADLRRNRRRMKSIMLIAALRSQPHKEAGTLISIALCIPEYHCLISASHETFISFILSATLLADGGFSFGPLDGTPSVFGFGLLFCEVESLGSSLVYGRNSGAPGMYFRSGSGTTIP